MAKPEDLPNADGKHSKDDAKEMRVIGVPRRRVDARAKVTGQTRFTDDILLPRMV